MKKVFSLWVVCLLCQAASAQNGFYIAPSFSAGTGYVHGQDQSSRQLGLFSYQASAGIGYQYKNWRLQSGLQYFSSGTRYTLGGDFALRNPEGPVFLQQQYTHIGIPLLLGYTFFPQKSFHLVPFLGLTTSYNINVREDSRGLLRTMEYRPFTAMYHRISLWGNAQVFGEYQVNNKIHVFGGPTLQYMLSGFNKAPEYGTTSANQRNYNIRFELGARIAF